MKSSSRKSSGSETYPKQDIIHWKYIWNDIISDVDFRNWIINKNTGFYQIFKNDKITDLSSQDTSKKDKLKGTFYMQFQGGHAHYVAYKILKSKIVIFDPSYPDGTFSGCLPDYIDTIQNYFDLPVEFDDQFGTPQTNKNDSFCQTWTICYLMNNKKLNKLLESSNDNPTESLYKICKHIISLSIFKEICNEQSNWINKNLKINKAPKKWNADYLLEYSELFDEEMFDYLF